MTGSAIPDEDLPTESGDYCAKGETYGFFQELFECRSGNDLYYRLICGGIELDIHPDRILMRHGLDVSLEVRADRIVSRAPVFEHTGDFKVTSGGSTFEVSGAAIEATADDLRLDGDLAYRDGVQISTGDGVSVDARDGRLLTAAKQAEHTGQVFVTGEVMVSGNVVSRPLFVARHPSKTWSVAIDQGAVVITSGISSSLRPYTAFTAAALRAILIDEGFWIEEYTSNPPPP